MCRLHKACDLMTFKCLKIRSLFLNLLPHSLLGLLSSLHYIYIPPSSHSKNHFFVLFTLTFCFSQTFVCQLFFHFLATFLILPACYTAQRIRDTLTQLCASCRTSDRIIEDVVKIKSEEISPIIADVTQEFREGLGESGFF